MASSYPRLRRLLERTPLWPVLDRNYGKLAWVRGHSHKVLLELLLRRRELSVLRVAGLRRAGNHALLFWYLAQRPGATLYLNDAHCDYSLSRQHKMASHSRLWLRPPRTLPPHLVVSHEDVPIAQLTQQVTRVDRFAPRTMIVVRNPYNLFASRLAWSISDIAGDDAVARERRAELVGHYKDYARVALGRTAPLGSELVVANYDRWVVDEDYRRGLAGELDVPFTDANKDHVTNYGGGSSFERWRDNRPASQMAVVDRWRRFADDTRLRQIAADTELRELSAELFSETDDLARWLDGCR